MGTRAKLSEKFQKLTAAIRRAEAKKNSQDLVDRLDNRLTDVWIQLNF